MKDIMEHLEHYRAVDPHRVTPNVDSARLQIAKTLADFYGELAGTAAKPAPRFSLTRAINEMANGGLKTGYEREVCSGAAMIAGGTFDMNRIIVPWPVFHRDLLVSNSGGYLAPVDNLSPIDALRPFSVVARLPITLLQNLAGSVTIPKTTAHVTSYWLGSENSAVSASEPTIGQIALTPRTEGSLVNISRLLLLQGPATEPFLRNEVLRSTGTEFDVGVIAGAGAAEPLGVVNTPGIGTTSGTSLSQAAVCEMLQEVAEANANDEAVSFLTTPAIRKLLQARERATGLDFIWGSDGRVAGQPAFVSTSVPAATMLCAHWPSIIVGMWGPGLEIQVNPDAPTLFAQGIVQMRCLLTADVTVAHVGAVNLASSIT